MILRCWCSSGCNTESCFVHWFLFRWCTCIIVRTTSCYCRRLVQMQQETCSKYAINSVNDIRLSSMLSSPNVYCSVYLLIGRCGVCQTQLTRRYCLESVNQVIPLIDLLFRRLLKFIYIDVEAVDRSLLIL